jgi:hypothetical protein
MFNVRQVGPVPKETREEVWRIFREWQENQKMRDVYAETAMENYEEENDEYEPEDDDEDEEEAYCPACGFPNCNGFCL